MFGRVLRSSICRAISVAGLAVATGVLVAALGGAFTQLHGTAAAARGNPRPGGEPSFALFETGQVRPLALSPEGRLLFAANTPANRLEIFAIAQPTAPTPGAVTWVASVPVGLEPVALAARSETQERAATPFI